MRDAPLGMFYPLMLDKRNGVFYNEEGGPAHTVPAQFPEEHCTDGIFEH